MTENQDIVDELNVEGYLTATLYKEAYIEIRWDSSLEMLEVKHLEQMQKVVSELGQGKKMPLLFSHSKFAEVNSESKKYATSDEGVKYTLAIAVLLDSLTKILLMNLFMRTSRPKVPTKGFSNREEAVVWLMNMSKEN